ncbi:MAG: dTDP-4-dehydrorhamnose 3,5-epimerase [Fluviicola sp.]|nr:MAG: dTDP-4-dehydrorhamnose 3,5-epimerase [Fluviicola sp.]
MKIRRGKINDLIIIEPDVFGDNRGYFFESFNENDWRKEVGFAPKFVQDNESMSAKGVLRGIHFQNPPDDQGKLVRVIQGSVLDVAVDLRKNSPTYGMHEKVVLSGKNKKQFYVPAGFGHGFLTLEDDTIFSYKCTEYYNPNNESGIVWNDPKLNIDWGVNSPLISDKDRNQQKFSNFATPF